MGTTMWSLIQRTLWVSMLTPSAVRCWAAPTRAGSSPGRTAPCRWSRRGCRAPSAAGGSACPWTPSSGRASSLHLHRVVYSPEKRRWRYLRDFIKTARETIWQIVWLLLVCINGNKIQILYKDDSSRGLSAAMEIQKGGPMHYWPLI